MAVGPHIEHAVELLGGRDDIAYGLHVTLNAEWERVKWKSLSGASIFVDESGYFLPFPTDTKTQSECLLREEMEQNEYCPEPADLLFGFAWEIRLQLDKLRDLGLPISYVDEHIGVSWIGFGLRNEIASLCKHYDFVDAHSFAYLPNVETSGDAFVDLEQRLKRAMLDHYVWVTHPGKDAPDMRNFFLKGGESGLVARERDAERALLVDERLPELFAKWRVKSCRYDEVK